VEPPAPLAPAETPITPDDPAEFEPAAAAAAVPAIMDAVLVVGVSMPIDRHLPSIAQISVTLQSRSDEQPDAGGRSGSDVQAATPTVSHKLAVRDRQAGPPKSTRRQYRDDEVRARHVITVRHSTYNESDASVRACACRVCAFQRCASAACVGRLRSRLQPRRLYSVRGSCIVCSCGALDPLHGFTLRSSRVVALPSRLLRWGSAAKSTTTVRGVSAVKVASAARRSNSLRIQRRSRSLRAQAVQWG
jgi:hypothetical protein